MTVQLGRHRHDVGANYLGGMKDTSRRLLKNIQQTSDTFEIGFQGVVTESELFLKLWCRQLWPFTVNASWQCGKGTKTVKRINRNTKEPFVTDGKETQVCRQWKLLLERKKLCSVPAKSQICTGEREDRTFTFDLLHLYC